MRSLLGTLSKDERTNDDDYENVVKKYCYMPRCSLTQQNEHCDWLILGYVPLIRLGSLRTRVFETRTATASELFSLLTCFHTTTFISLSIFSLLDTLSLKSWERPRSWRARYSLPVAVRVSKTRVLKLPILFIILTGIRFRSCCPLQMFCCDCWGKSVII